ncbi:hypothetical protein DL766_003147 [Monosporascus sp. MC13-8B]|uniref:MRG domain-containing protein n=1 Tax=Monosporascus cannonballus TaxID=155416 RepID=A0ABY0H9I9_9PEZI|nr:hypothetical protein DL763_009830 [Monosporascus cannonballus]RYO84955.1 hypothetical protein DL762_005420 [Monosporascus cannonballus]RYP34054.1 hypothetical protein DL766_003147 [Monosporascus sp. MC13-8B]
MDSLRGRKRQYSEVGRPTSDTAHSEGVEDETGGAAHSRVVENAYPGTAARPSGSGATQDTDTWFQPKAVFSPGQKQMAITNWLASVQGEADITLSSNVKTHKANTPSKAQTPARQERTFLENWLNKPRDGQHQPQNSQAQSSARPALIAAPAVVILSPTTSTSTPAPATPKHYALPISAPLSSTSSSSVATSPVVAILWAVALATQASSPATSSIQNLLVTTSSPALSVPNSIDSSPSQPEESGSDYSPIAADMTSRKAAAKKARAAKAAKAKATKASKAVSKANEVTKESEASKKSAPAVSARAQPHSATFASWPPRRITRFATNPSGNGPEPAGDQEIAGDQEAAEDQEIVGDQKPTSSHSAFFTDKAIAARQRAFIVKEAQYAEAAEKADPYLGELPPEDRRYLNERTGKLLVNDDRFTQPAAKDPPKHPKVREAEKNGTLSDQKLAWYAGMPDNVHIPTAGIPKEEKVIPAPKHLVSFDRLPLSHGPSDSEEDAFHARPSVKLKVPDSLKAFLVDDWENVTKNNQLVPLPHPRPVTKIIEDYAAYETPKRPEGSAQVDILEETLAGLKEYFDKALGRILLYRFERAQYAEAHAKWLSNDPEWEDKKTASATYGAEHLMRLIVSLPELIAQTNMDQQSVNRLREEMTKLTNWLAKHAEDYFVSEYETPNAEYIEKAKN